MSEKQTTLFLTTRWTLVCEAARGGDTSAVAALGALFSTYWPPLYRYVGRQGKSSQEAEDHGLDFVQWKTFLAWGAQACPTPTAPLDSARARKSGAPSRCESLVDEEMTSLFSSLCA